MHSTHGTIAPGLEIDLAVMRLRFLHDDELTVMQGAFVRAAVLQGRYSESVRDPMAALRYHQEAIAGSSS